MAFQCKKCKYKFKNRDPNKQEPPKYCPWCNAEGTVVPLKTAEEIVKDIDSMLD